MKENKKGSPASKGGSGRRAHSLGFGSLVKGQLKRLASVTALSLAVIGSSGVAFAQTTAQSVANDGTLPNQNSYISVVSDDGNLVFF